MLFVNLFVFINALIIFGLFFFRKNNSLPNRILAFIFLIPSLYFLNSALLLSGLIHKIPWLFFTVQLIAPAFQILVYMYVQLFLGKKIKLNTILTILSVLLLSGIIYITVNFYASGTDVRQEYMYSLLSNSYPPDMFVYTSSYYIVLMIYLIVLVNQVFSYKRAVVHSLSNYDMVHLSYITRFVLMLFALNFIMVAFYLLLPMYYVDYLILPIAVMMVYLFIFYFSFHYSAVFTRYGFNRFYHDGIITQKELIPEQFEEMKMTEITGKHKKIIDLLLLAIEKEKIFINPNLSLKSLSEKLNYPSYLISQAINLHYNKSFFDLVNENRVIEAQKRLKNLPQNKTIESVAFEVGFNSRASFYRAFKKYAGETPKEIFGMSQILN
jgi:AraC-like DNA-binding protein